MRTVIVGGGRGCRAILKLLQAGHLRELQMEVVCVADPDPEAPGLVYAREKRLQTLADYTEAIELSGIELVLELTGDDSILADIYHRLPLGVRVIDHASARVFWDVIAMEQSLRDELLARAELEQKLESDRARAQHILDSLPDIVVVLDKDRKILQANARFSDACGSPLNEAIGTGCRDVFCSASQDPRRVGREGCPFDEAVALGHPVSSIVERHHPTHGYWEVTASPQYDAGGNLVNVVETHHPVTKRILLQREVEQSERRFRQFIESAHDIISIKDRQGRYLVYNPASAALFSRDPLEFIGRTAEEIYEPDIAGIITGHDREVMEKREHRTYSERYIIDGKEYVLQTVRFPLFDFEGQVEGVATIARDVTQEHELQKQLLQSAKLAAVGKLAAGVAHEINNPLTGVLAYAEDLRDDTEPDDARRADYEVIIRETLRCRAIVRNLLDFSRQQDPVFQTVDLNDVVARSLALVEKLPRFRDIGLTKQLADEPLPVTADARQLQQVLLNLIINANDAMDGHGANTIASGRQDSADACWMSVLDTGPGVPEPLRERIFEPFYSTKATSGLGLAVSWGIVERHGGHIDVESNPQGGALFRVVLPVAHY
jgi:two-component system NtrC family sensor kinase